MASNLVDIFAIAEEEEKLSNENKNFERTVVFVGEKSSGKSSIINLLKGGQKEEAPKPTYAMEYNFAKRSTNNRKEVVHLYEVGGGRQLSDLLGAPLTKESYRYIVYVIVVDLSKPSTIMDSINYWTNAIRDSVKDFLRRNNDIPQEDLEYVRSITQTDVFDDKVKINSTGVPTVVVGNKYDLYEEIDPEMRKWVSRIMRYSAHANLCALYYCSLINQKLSLQIRTLLSNYFFGGVLPNVLQKDYTKPLFLNFGSDSVDSMGIPTSGTLSVSDVLNKMSREYFPPEKDESQKKAAFYDINKYPEAKIDSTKVEKDLEMERNNKFKQSESPSSNFEQRNIKRDNSEVINNKQENIRGNSSEPEFANARPPSGTGPGVKKARPVVVPRTRDPTFG